MEKLKAIQLSKSVYWVGAIDWNVRNFHGYTTDRGTTYNAYLIMADKITLVDFVKAGFTGELLARVSSVVDPAKIDYIISNHAEPDHTGALPEVLAAVRPEKVFTSTMGVKALQAHYHDAVPQLTAVKDGETLSLGNLTVRFMETRMLHWPDSMFSYVEEEQVLFSQDAFGMHLATAERFDDELPWELLAGQSAEYYANIITLYSPQVTKLLQKVSQSGLRFSVVAPDHGPVWRSMDNFGKMLGLYAKWANRELSHKAVIVYDTMWKSTEKMARYIEDGVRSEGVAVETMGLQSNDRSAVASAMLDAAALIAGAPTLNNNLFPSLADALTYLRGLKFKTPLGAVFGSYGWSGEAVKQLREYLESMGTELVGEVASLYVPDDEIQKKCFELGAAVARRIKERVPRG